VQVEIWSDVVCPWCYIGKRRFEAALTGFQHRDDVTVTWRSFLLAPDTPKDFGGSSTDYLVKVRGYAPDEVQVMQGRVTALAAAEGLDFRLDDSRTGPTVDAHRLLHLAAHRGLGEELKERLLRAYFTEGEPIADVDTLVSVAAEVGLDPEEARTVLEGDAYLDEVNADFAQARAYGINGVPFFVVDQKFGVSGAQSTEVFADLLERAWTDAHPLSMVGAEAHADHDATASCDDGSCAV